MSGAVLLFVGLLIGFLVARDRELDVTLEREKADYLAKNRDYWSGQYFDELCAHTATHVVLNKERAQAAEQLKDAVELERYLRDEERDFRQARLEELCDDCNELVDGFNQLMFAIRRKGATIKDIRRRLSEGDL